MKTVEVRKTLSATPERVFQAWSDPQQMQRWFCPSPDGCKLAANDLAVGGYYMILMLDDETHYPHYGVYKTIDPARALAFTWSSPMVSDTLVTIEFTESSGQTELTLRHTGLKTQEEHDAHERGWKSCMEHLSAALGR